MPEGLQLKKLRSNKRRVGTN